MYLMNRPTQICLVVAMILGASTQAISQTVPVVVAKRDISANTVLAVADLEVTQWEIQKTPGKSFAEIDSIIGQTVINKILANSPVLKTNLANTATTITAPANSEAHRIVAIPVSISTRYVTGEFVRLTYENADGRRNTIADNLKVFHIGEPDTLQGKDGKQIFIRFVSVLAPLAVVEKISNSINNQPGVHLLEKLASDPARPALPTETSTRVPQSRQQPAVRNFANDATPSLPKNQQTYADQLRQMARMLESQAAELEEQGRYEQADLIREACQKLREAARVGS